MLERESGCKPEKVTYRQRASEEERARKSENDRTNERTIKKKKTKQNSARFDDKNLFLLHAPMALSICLHMFIAWSNIASGSYFEQANSVSKWRTNNQKYTNN